MKFSAVDAVVLDMDGVLWRGNDPLPGMQEVFQWFDEQAIPFALATNNSGKTPADYIQKLRRMGVQGVPESAIVTSGMATAMYLQKRYPAGTRVHVFGMDGLRRIMDAAGFDTADADGQTPNVVVAGINFDLTYERLKKAALYVRDGATFIGTNDDSTFPSPEGLVPGAGSMIAALETATGQQATIIGKPGLPMFEAALEIVRTAPERTLMVGDRLNTDIQGAQQAGMKTALVLTGITSPDELSSAENDIWPDVAFEGLPELLRAWAGFEWYNEKMKARRGR